MYIYLYMYICIERERYNKQRTIPIHRTNTKEDEGKIAHIISERDNWGWH